jgi:hypothetical protein
MINRTLAVLKIKGKLKYLFISLVLLLLVYPYVESHLEWLNIILTVVLISALYVVSYDTKHLEVGIALFLPTLITHWLSLQGNYRIIPFVFSILFYFYAIYILLIYIIKASEVTSDLIFGAISLYLLIGIAFGAVYAIIYILHPSSFLIPTGSTSTWSAMTYFSFVSLTTTGFGDVLPTESYTQSIAMLEAVAGQMFIAVLVARMVGIYIYYKTKQYK